MTFCQKLLTKCHGFLLSSACIAGLNGWIANPARALSPCEVWHVPCLKVKAVEEPATRRKISGEEQ